MRFIAEGPSIPDDLLLARDQGRVIFFCGAGVSRARAGLPDFFGLAEKVISALGVPQDSAACKLIREAQEIDQRIGVSGVISADRVFGLVEREFLSRDIEAAVASALKPTVNCDLSAHKTLLDLATTPEGVVRLVTTNFDRLFDICGRDLQTWQPPRLPDPARPAEMDGIIYLHGKVTPKYDGAEGDGFVLSSSEFGRAYLSDGWATSFFRSIIDRYVVVFVGYTADDPPVQYLLEALNRTSGKLDNVYAFQSGGASDASARWRHKGVEAIAYQARDGHAALWRTLEAWAGRAKDPNRWYSDVIQSSKMGPAALAPHERGQVAHIISTYEGLKKFSEGNNPSPAEWLCVFDPSRRYAKPGWRGNFQQRGPYVDPFDLYGLDSDIPPKKIDPEDHFAKREIPPGAWDAFTLNRLDRNALRDDNFPSIRGHFAATPSRLVPRLDQLGIWISTVSDQPAAVWWAAHQTSLHSNVRSQIRWHLERSEYSSTSQIRQAWRFLLDVWERNREEAYRDWHGLQTSIVKDGWDDTYVRQYAEIRRPYFEAGSDYFGGAVPPDKDSEVSINDLLRRSVKYPEKHADFQIPDQWVAATTKSIRQNLELALALETEIGEYGLSNISPIVAEENNNIDNYERTHGLSGAIFEFCSLFRRLISLDASSARQEFGTWPAADDTIFARLRIWTAGIADFILPAEFREVIENLSDPVFWDSRHQRDLLLALSARWQDIDEQTRRSIEDRLLSGPSRWENEEDDHFDERSAWSVLTRVCWLSNRGCHFSFKLEDVTHLLQSKAPQWKPEYAEKAAESLEGRGGFVKTKTDHALLLAEPLSLILSRARELSGRTEDFLVENDPFAGLAAGHPVRALSALTLAAKAGEFPEWAWRRFLNSESRKNDKPRFVRQIAERLASYSEDVVATIIRPISDWLLTVSKILAVEHPLSFDKVMQKLIGVFHLQPVEGRSAIVRGNREPDWTTEALNAPAGKVAQAVFSDPRIKDLQVGKGFPTSWLRYANDLLRLNGDMRRHAIVFFFHSLNWFYAIDPQWAEENLIAILEGDNAHDRDAAWAGFLWGARVPNQKLYMRLKADLLAFATARLTSRRAYVEVLAAIILAGWGTVDDRTDARCISNEEMRSLLLNADEEFRSRVLWQVEIWANDDNSEPGTKWADMLVELLGNVWPRQISAKSPLISARLCDLAFSNEERFPRMVEIILPLLTKIDRDHLMIPNLRGSKDNIVDHYPKLVLALLSAVLPENATAWPYGIEAVLTRIGEVGSLNADERFIVLKRRWDAR